jgi:hypothetical protein
MSATNETARCESRQEPRTEPATFPLVRGRRPHESTAPSAEERRRWLGRLLLLAESLGALAADRHRDPVRLELLRDDVVRLASDVRAGGAA